MNTEHIHDLLSNPGGVEERMCRITVLSTRRLSACKHLSLLPCHRSPRSMRLPTSSIAATGTGYRIKSFDSCTVITGLAPGPPFPTNAISFLLTSALSCRTVVEYAMVTNVNRPPTHSPSGAPEYFVGAFYVP